MIDRNDLDAVAAEYVLGTLSRSERDEVTAARGSDADMAQAIAAWEKRLAPLHENTPDIAPSAGLYAKIERRILMQARPDSASMVRQIRQWRTMALAASVAFAVVVGVALYNGPAAGPTALPVALLQKDATAPAFLVSLNEKDHALAIHALAAEPPTGKSYELWMIAANAQAPVSLGVLPTRDAKIVDLKNMSAARVRQATLAVSIEPMGGSPTGAPTGPVVFTGKFVQPI